MRLRLRTNLVLTVVFALASLAQAMQRPAHAAGGQEPVERVKPQKATASRPLPVAAAKSWIILQQPINIAFDQTPLADAIKQIKQVTAGPEVKAGLPIYLDPASLLEVDKTDTSPVSLRIDDVPLETTLNLLLKQLGLAYHVQRSGIVAIEVDRGGEAGAERPTAPVTAKAARTWIKLAQPVDMHFETETPLADVLKYIRQATQSKEKDDQGVMIYVDKKSLEDVDKTETSPVSLSLEGVPLSTSLRLMLQQIELTYHVQEDGLLVIDGKEEADDAPDAEAEKAVAREAEMKEAALVQVPREIVREEGNPASEQKTVAALQEELAKLKAEVESLRKEFQTAKPVASGGASK